MFGITKSTSELTAVAQTPECRYHLGLGINNVQVAVNGMDGDKRSHLLSLCGQLLKQVLTPCHIAIEASQWIRTTALSYAAEMDGHVLGTLCAPIALTCVFKDYLELAKANPWRSSSLPSSNST